MTTTSEPPSGIRDLLDSFAAGDPAQALRLGELLADLRQSAFGMFLLVALLPAFIPIPGVGGAIGGPLVILIGLQLLAGLRKPWLPRFIAMRGPRRATLARYAMRLGPWLRRLERLVKPRLPLLLDSRVAQAFGGLLLLLLGVLLALPIPLTNYLFGGLLLLHALALLERDGALLLLAWVLGAAAIVVFGILSGSLTALVGEWVGRLA